MKVYLLFGCYHGDENQYLLGIFTTHEKAQMASQNYVHDDGIAGFFIEERTIDE